MTDTGPGAPRTEGRRVDRAVAVEGAADAYVRAFELNGARYFFNSPGSEFAPLWERFAGTEADAGRPESPDRLENVGCRHEELAIHLAMGYTGLTGEPQVVGLHANVGSLHAAMSMHGAFRNNVPMLIITSHADTHEGEFPGGTPGPHYLSFEAPGGAENYYARYVKWLAHPSRNENATRYLARAFRIARTPPQGPVVLNLSRELLYDDALTEADLIREVPGTPATPDPAVLDQLTDKLEQAENPLIISGLTELQREASDRVVELAEGLDAPVLQNPTWSFGVPVEHPLSLGSGAFVSDHLAAVDLVLVVGSTRPWYPPESGAPPDAEIVILSSDPAQPKLDYWNYPADWLVTGEPASTLSGILERRPTAAVERSVDWRAEHERLRAYWRTRASEGRDAIPIDPFWLCGELDRQLPNDAVIVDETIVHRHLVANLIESRDRRYLPSGLLLAGGIGGGLGMALGAKLAEPDRPAVALLGDGSYNYNPVSAAFGAADEHELPFLAVVFNNGGYQSQKASHVSAYPDGRAVRTGDFPSTSIEPNPRYDRQVAAWDVHGARVTHPEELAGAVETALAEVADGNAALLDVILEERPPELEYPG